MNKIIRVSIFFRVVFQVLFVAMPIVFVISWLYAPEPMVFLHGIFSMAAIPNSYNDKILHALTANEKLLGFTISLVPLAIHLCILYFLIKLFRLYERGEIFSLGTVHYIRNVGYALLIGELVHPFYEASMGVVLTMANPPGHRIAVASLSETNIGILLTALLVILISWIMAEGCRLREEQQLTI